MSNGSVLHAEDDDNDALLFSVAAQQAGLSHPLIRVRDGQEAREHIISARVSSSLSALITDLKMPNFSGFELLSWIQRHVPQPRFPVIVLTGSFHEHDKDRSFELGADAYFVKPTSVLGLVQIIKQINQQWLLPTLSHA